MSLTRRARPLSVPRQAAAHVVMSEVVTQVEGERVPDAEGRSVNFHTASGVLEVKALPDGRMQMDFPVYL